MIVSCVRVLEEHIAARLAKPMTMEAYAMVRPSTTHGAPVFPSSKFGLMRMIIMRQ
jgi:hypothetical protein